jgi:hypothetical protein
VYSPSKEELAKGVQELQQSISQETVSPELANLKDNYDKLEGEAKDKLLAEHYTKNKVQEMAGTPKDPNDPKGWKWLTNAQASWPYAICVIMFALFMIPGGRIQDRISPRFGATVGGLFLAGGCIAAGLMESFAGLIIGFGILGGIGMGIGYAAPTPAAPTPGAPAGAPARAPGAAAAPTPAAPTPAAPARDADPEP